MRWPGKYTLISAFLSFVIIWGIFSVKSAFYDIGSHSSLWLVQISVVVHSLLATIPFFIFFHTFFLQPTKKARFRKPLQYALLGAVPVSLLLQGFLASNWLFGPWGMLKATLSIYRHLYFYEVWVVSWLGLAAGITIAALLVHWDRTTTWFRVGRYILLMSYLIIICGLIFWPVL